jgi:hypothetical protein
MAQPAAAVAIAVGIDGGADEEATPVEVTKPAVVEMTKAPVMVPTANVTPANGTDEVGRGLAEVGLDGR